MSSMSLRGDSETGVVMNALVSEPETLRTMSSSSAGTASLPINCADYETSENLLSVFMKNRKGFLFLQFTGNYWPQVDWKDCTAYELSMKLLYLLNRVALATVFIIYLETLLTSNINSAFTMLAMITILVDTASVVPAQYSNQNRLLQFARVQDGSVLDECTQIAAQFLAVFMITAVLFTIFFILLNGINSFSAVLIFVLLVGEFSLSGYLSFNLLMLLMDLKVSSLLIDQLFILADQRALSLDKFELVRNDVRRRVESSRWAADFIVIPCICSTIVLAVICQTKDLRAYNVTLLLLKEIMFVALAFWYVAKVNEKADMLTRKLCRTMWNVSEQQSKASGHLSDTERLTVCSTSMVEPISFTLLFKRLSLENVAVSFAGVIMSVLAGVLKQAILHG